MVFSDGTAAKMASLTGNASAPPAQRQTTPTTTTTTSAPRSQSHRTTTTSTTPPPTPTTPHSGAPKSREHDDDHDNEFDVCGIAASPPVLVEVDRAGRRFYATSGWFSRGVWFAGGGAGFQTTRRSAASVSFSRSWTTADPVGGTPRDRSELSGGIAWAVTASIGAFAALTQTIATLPENGAGATVSAGLSFYVKPARTAAPPRRRGQ